MQHWPVLILGFFVVTVFVLVLTTFSVRETEVAIINRLGKARKQNGVIHIYEPGLHFKIPFIDEVWKHDRRIHCYDLRKGKYAQIQTADDHQIVVATYVNWRVSKTNTESFITGIKTTAKAQAQINDLVRNHRESIIPQYKLGEIINTDSTKIKLQEIEDRIFKASAKDAEEKYGIEITHVGFKHIGFPQSVADKVFLRMQAEREKIAGKYITEGQMIAQKIISDATTESNQITSNAKAEAMKIRGQGDQQAAEYYNDFMKDKDLAIFLRKLDALKNLLTEKDTMVLDFNTPPFDILRLDSMKIKLDKGNK